MKKNGILIAIIILAIGFATVSTTLIIGGTIGIGADTDDYDIIFTSAKIGTIDQTIKKTNKTADTIEFDVLLNKVGEEKVLEYTVKNNSTQYEANANMKCYAINDTDEFMTKYITISGELAGKTITFAQVASDALLSDEINFKAQESKNGTITMSLKKSYAGESEISVTLNCEIITNADSSDEVKDKVVPVVKLEPGLYAADGTTTYTWEELKTEGLIRVNNGEVKGPEDWNKKEELVGNLVLDEEVTSIGNNAFFGCGNLTSVEIPDSVTSIEYEAFEECGSLTSITIGSGVTSIGNAAFRFSPNLTSIKVDENNPKYDSRNNSNAIIETATNTLIQGCKNTIIPEGITSIRTNAFEGCTGITSIEIPSSVTSIGESAFSGCYSLTSVTIGSGVTSIGNYAFVDTNITSIKIPNNVTSIGDYAFSSTGITSIEIPASVTSIGEMAFFGTPMTNIVVDENNPTYDSRNNSNAIIETATNKLIQGSSNTIIPGSVTSIEEGAFRGTSITSIEIPASVISIGEKAFDGCENLISVTIGSGVTSIGDSAFSRIGITSIEIPASVTSIGAYAFAYNKNLTSVTFVNPNGWQAIDQWDSSIYNDLSSTDLANPSTAATYLKNTYSNRDWTRS